MRHSSLLRYPGGKAAMTGLLSDIRRINRLGDRSIAEPFAGGAGASLKLLFLEEAYEIFINDADPAIFDFWWMVINRPRAFLRRLDRTPIEMHEWRRQRDLYRSGGRVSRSQRGFAAFYLNRCNRSGIIMNGGLIGGVNQNGKWKLDARFNKKELRCRCERIVEYRDRIHVSGRNGLDFINEIDLESTMLFLDPPYFVKGKTLYLNILDEDYHSDLASKLKSLIDAAWVLTYDNCPEILKLYEGWTTIRPFSLRYSAAVRRAGKEVLIVPKWMKLPSVQSSAAVNW